MGPACVVGARGCVLSPAFGARTHLSSHHRPPEPMPPSLLQLGGPLSAGEKSYTLAQQLVSCERHTHTACRWHRIESDDDASCIIFVPRRVARARLLAHPKPLGVAELR